MGINLSDYKDIWVYAEQRDGKLMNVALELFSRGVPFNSNVFIFLKIVLLKISFCFLISHHTTTGL